MSRISLQSFRRSFSGEILEPGDPGFDQHREVWNAIVDRQPVAL